MTLDGAPGDAAARHARTFLRFALTMVDLARRQRTWPLADISRRLDAGEDPWGLLAESAAADRSWLPLSAVIDFLMSRLSGLGPEEAWRLDRRWRGNRVLAPGDVARDVAAAARAARRPGLAAAVVALGRGRVGSAARALAADLAPDLAAGREGLALVERACADLAASGAVGREATVDELARELSRRVPAPHVPAPAPLSLEGPVRPGAPRDPGRTPVDGTDLVVCRRDERVGSLPRLSASQLESYRECPGKWLALRRLGVGTVDAGFAGVQLGSTAHRLLEGVHRGLYERACHGAGVDPSARPLGPVPGSQVGPETLDDARSLLNSLFLEDMGTQLRSFKRAAQQSVVPHDEGELEALRGLLCDLSGFLAWEAARPDALEPRWFEAPFGRDEPCVIGGVSVVGTVDRVDVAADGTARVVDYKHRLPTGEYAAAGPVGPRHVQSLLYARLLSAVDPRLSAQGAAYLCTRPPFGAQGAATAAAAGALVGTRGEEGIGHHGALCSGQQMVSVVSRDVFEGMLDDAARSLSACAASLAAGELSADPVDAEACSFCPAEGCPSRLGPAGHEAAVPTPESVVGQAVAFLAQPADTRDGLYPLLTGPLFSLGADDLLLLTTGEGDRPSTLRHRRLDRGVLAGEEGLVSTPSPSLSRALSVLGRAVAEVGDLPLHEVVRHLVEGSGWPARLAARGPEGAVELGRLAAALSRLAARTVPGGLGASSAARPAPVTLP